jgi:hypothetical protein
MLDFGEKLKGGAQLVSGVHDEVFVESAEEAVMAEVQSFMSARSAEIFDGQTIGVEAPIADSWAGDVKVPGYTDTRSAENAKQINCLPHELMTRQSMAADLAGFLSGRYNFYSPFKKDCGRGRPVVRLTFI